MRRSTINRFHRFTAVASVFAAIAITPLTLHAEYKCNEPQGMLDKRACGQAAAGPDALRRFVERTRMIYGLYFWDYALREPPSAVTVSSAIEPMSTAAKEPMAGVNRRN